MNLPIPSKRPGSAFTLIELLVGVAVEAIAHNAETMIFEKGQPDAARRDAWPPGWMITWQNLSPWHS